MFAKIIALFRKFLRKKDTCATKTQDNSANALKIKFATQKNLPLTLRESLNTSKIFTVQDILSYTPQEILLLPNVGLESFTYLLDFLERYGVVLGTIDGKEKFIQKESPIVQKQMIPQDILDMRFDEQPELSTRIVNALSNENIYTVADIMAYTPQKLMLIPNMGTSSINRLLKFLEEHGIAIGIPYGIIASDENKKPTVYDISAKDFIIKNCDQRISDILISRYRGLTLEELGEKYNLTRQRIQQICEKFNWKKIKACFKEDTYKDLFQKYNWDIESFCYVTKADKFTYGYLRERYTKGKLSPEEFFPDTTSLPSVKTSETVISTYYRRNLKYEKIICDGVEYIRITRYKHRLSKKNHDETSAPTK